MFSAPSPYFSAASVRSSSSGSSVSPVLEMKHIVKTFPGVRALDDVHFRAFPHEVTALLGENGSGKSTLMKVLTGIYRPDSGDIFWQGQNVHFNNVTASQKASIALIHQELNLFPNLTIAENIFFGREPLTRWGNLDRTTMNRQAAQLTESLGIAIAPDGLLGDLDLGHQQIIEIAKALSIQAKLIVFDEPTTALTQKEVDTLFTIIRGLRDQGRAVIYISHRLQEIFLLADRIAVLRDGKMLGERLSSETDEDELVYLMVGRTITEKYPYVPPQPQSLPPVLEVENFKAGPLRPVSFSIHKGELVGIAGLMGAGRSELARALFALYGRSRASHGTLKINGTGCTMHHPYTALRHGICYVSEDRKKDGLFLELSIFFNITITSLHRFVKFFIYLKDKMLRTAAKTQAATLNIKAANLDQHIKELSGGNQQKTAIARALASQPKLIIFDEPTKGIDVGAKLEIYNLMNTLKQQGLAIIMISSDMSEVLGLSDRILVMARHEIVGEFSRQDVTSEKIMKLALAD